LAGAASRAENVVSEIREPHIAIGFQPFEDNLVVRLVATEGTDEGVAWGDVVAVGPGRRTSDGALIAPNAAPGDRVALRPRAAIVLRLGGQSFAIVGGADVLGVLLPGARVKRPRPPGEAAAGPAPQQVALEDATRVEAEESLETDVAPDLLDREAPTAEDLH
jgi:co-chaperonin GroES (HSP10)